MDHLFVATHSNVGACTVRARVKILYLVSTFSAKGHRRGQCSRWLSVVAFLGGPKVSCGIYNIYYLKIHHLQYYGVISKHTLTRSFVCNIELGRGFQVIGNGDLETNVRRCWREKDRCRLTDNMARHAKSELNMFSDGRKLKSPVKKHKIPTFSGSGSERLERGPQYAARRRNFQKSLITFVVLRIGSVFNQMSGTPRVLE